jgi:ABC-type glutathione transport system ATPase component
METMPEDAVNVDRSLPCALRVIDAEFEWPRSEQAQGNIEDEKKANKGSRSPSLISVATLKNSDDDSKTHDKSQASDILDADANKNQPFGLRNISLEVSRGALVGIVGSFGSGKVKLLHTFI